MINIKNLNKSYSHKNSKEDIVIGYSALNISLPLFIAMEKKFFQKKGVVVRLKKFDTAQPLINAILNGNIQAGGYTALPISLNKSIKKNIDLYHMSPILEGSKNPISYFITSINKKESSWSDVKGKKIGILPTDAYKFWVKEILKIKNIKLDEVKIIPINPGEQLNSLKNGDIDFLFTNDPVATTIIQKKIGISMSVNDGIEMSKIFGDPYIFGSFNIRKDFADKNPVIYKKISDALDESINFINNNQNSSKKIMKKYIHKTQKDFVKFFPDSLYKKNIDLKEGDFSSIIKKYRDMEIIKEHIESRDLIFPVEDYLKEFINKKYIFKNFSLDIGKNEVVGLFGINGSGKSTLLNIINNTDKGYSGSVKILSKNISYVYQKPTDTLLPWYTCKENILLALDYNDLDRDQGEILLEELAEKLKIDFSLYSYPLELSGGQQQIVTILRAFITQPDILLLDEPFAALDIERRINVIDLFKLYKGKMTIIITSHRGDEISSILDRVIVLKNQPVNIANDFSLKDMRENDFQKKVNQIRFNQNEKK